MLSNRVIPILLLDKEGLVKTRKLKNSSYIGDPVNAIRIFNDKEVDELVLLDINASKKNIEPDYEMIEMIAGECFMPLSYGGGVKNIEQAKKIFSLGVEKISLQSSIIENYELLRQISEKFGASSVIASIDVKKNIFGQHKLYCSKTKRVQRRSWIEHFKNCMNNGAGEILLNSVENDGLQNGINKKIIYDASQITKIPLIYAGGVGSLNDIKKIIDSGADAAGVGAFFVYHGPHNAVLITYPKYETLKNLLKN